MSAPLLKELYFSLKAVNDKGEDLLFCVTPSYWCTHSYLVIVDRNTSGSAVFLSEMPSQESHVSVNCRYFQHLAVGLRQRRHCERENRDNKVQKTKKEALCCWRSLKRCIHAFTQRLSRSWQKRRQWISSCCLQQQHGKSVSYIVVPHWIV